MSFIKLTSVFNGDEYYFLNYKSIDHIYESGGQSVITLKNGDSALRCRELPEFVFHKIENAKSKEIELFCDMFAVKIAPVLKKAIWRENK